MNCIYPYTYLWRKTSLLTISKRIYFSVLANRKFIYKNVTFSSILYSTEKMKSMIEHTLIRLECIFSWHKRIFIKFASFVWKIHLNMKCAALSFMHKLLCRYTDIILRNISISMLTLSVSIYWVKYFLEKEFGVFFSLS